MTHKIIAGIVTCLLIVSLIVLFTPGKQASTPQNKQEQNQTQQIIEEGTEPVNPSVTTENQNQTPATTQDKNPSTDGRFSDEANISAGVDVQVKEIIYDGSSFQPAQLNIKIGDVVIFRNKSTTSFWPASAPHPKHTDYPEFDPKKAIAAGGTFEFKFTKPGNWKFHDHINPKAYGTITVTQ